MSTIPLVKDKYRERQRSTVAATALLVCAAFLSAGDKRTEADNPAPATVDYVTDIQPLLKKHCYDCHDADTAESGLRLDARRPALQGGDSGAAIVPGKSGESRLIAVVAGTDEDFDRMPPEGEGEPLNAEEIGLLKKWIDEGAKWPEDADDEEVRRRASDHWAFQPIQDPPLPPVRRRDWPRGGIDRFILARLEREGVSPSPETDRATLMRRVYLDVIGLLPSPAEVEAFLADKKDDAYERLVDRLLASPHYGERWGRIWLDAARYADTDGYEKDRARPYAWRYRDWVIKALNDDMPFDQFTMEQIAGDLLPDAGTEQKVATGFHRNTLINREGGIDPEEDRVKRTVDRTNTVGEAWLGITLQCANCHSHKYDPFSQREYFQFYAFFNSLSEPDIDAPLPGAPNQSKGVKAQVVAELGSPRETRIHIRGDFLSKGDPVECRTPEVLPPLKVRGDRPDRLDLSRWLVDPANPLTARVAVNHVWQHYFGRGIVPTENDFGTQGEPPSHPELLDWLSTRFSKDGWSKKRLHRLILTSATYRQSAAVRPKLAQRDPYNAWLSHQNRLRVEAEIVRDLALSAGGLLVPKVGGPSVRPPQPKGIEKLGYANSVKWQTSPGDDRYRRGLYTFFQRTVPYPMLMTFDSPDSNTSCTRRARSNTPLQALTLWNDAVFFECAQALGRRVVREVPASDNADATVDQRIRHAYRLCLTRDPEGDELEIVREVYEEHLRLGESDAEETAKLVGPAEKPAGATDAELAAWIMVGRTLINLDEFITRE
jgi:hypothetical protein